MTPTRRTPPARNRGSPKDIDNEINSEPSPCQLLSNKEVPFWYFQNYIYTGYRPVNHSIQFCFRSLGYLHNETVNIYSHLVPALIALVLAFLVTRYFDATFRQPHRETDSYFKYICLPLSFALRHRPCIIHFSAILNTLGTDNVRLYCNTLSNPWSLCLWYLCWILL